MVFNSISFFLQQENSVLQERLNNAANSICDICNNLKVKRGLNNLNKFSPLSTLSNAPKRSAAFVLAFIFMVSFNVGPYLSNTSPELLQYSDQSLSIPSHPIGTRNLLWIDDSSENNNSSEPPDNIENVPKIYPTCPVSVSVNQTESIRLASELKRWIGDFPEYFNLTKSITKTPNDFDLNQISNYLLSDSGGMAIKSFYKQMKSVRNYIRKTGNYQTINAQKKQQKEKRLDHLNLSNGNTVRNFENIQSNAANEKRIQIYSPAYSNAIKYAEFFEEIHRQDDTFYVVSFSGDHLLLPAVAHNKTFRPKMSLMLPAVGNLNNNSSYTGDGLFTLMQIDCEVVNTSMLQIKQSSIPDHLWNRTTSMPLKKARDNTVPMSRGQTQAQTAQRTNNERNGDNSNFPLNNDNENIVNKLNRNALDKNITNNRQKAHEISVNDGNQGDPLKPYKPYFLRKPNSNEKVFNENSVDLL